MSTAVATVRVHPEKYKKDFNAVVTSLTQYIDKRAPTLSVKVTSVTQIRPAKWQKASASCSTFKGKIKLETYSQEEYDSMSAMQHHQLDELQKKARLVKGKKTPESSRALEARVAALEAKTENSSNESLFADEKPKANNRNNAALNRKGNNIRQSHAYT